VLARRDAAARARAREVAGPERLGEPEALDDEHDLGDDDLLDAYDEWHGRDTLLTRAREAVAASARRAMSLLPRRSRDRAPLTPAGRRRRLLLTLLAACLVTLLGALVLTPLLLVAHAVADLLVVLYVVQLRRLVLARAAARPAPRRREVAPAAPAAPVVPADVPDDPVADGAEGVAQADEPVAPAPPVPAVARHDEPLPVAVGLGAPWSPVPVPPPLYSRAPVAPRMPRTVDLTRPGAYTEAVAAGEQLPGMEDEPSAAPRQSEPRRAVNDW
jgi:hypothetical protein